MNFTAKPNFGKNFEEQYLQKRICANIFEWYPRSLRSGLQMAYNQDIFCLVTLKTTF